MDYIMVNELVATKEDIKLAIEDKQSEITGGMSTYADAIRNIPEYAIRNVIVKNKIKLAESTFDIIPDKIEFAYDITDMSYMFAFCYNLIEIPWINTWYVEDIGNMCTYCSSLTTISFLDCRKVKNASGAFNQCYNLTNLGGFIDLGAERNLTYFGLDWCDKLTYNSVMSVIYGLYDRARAGYPTATLRLSYNTLRLLSNNDIAHATNKGWIIG